VKAVVQRVSGAKVTPGGEIGPGLCVLLGVARDDTAEDAVALAGKIARLRIFERDGKFDVSLLDTGGAALVVSQFTLLADTAKGNRPSFTDAAPPRGGRAALRSVLRGAPRARRRGGDGRVRSEDGGRARQRRAGDDRRRPMSFRAPRGLIS
jgi:D-tyrosyl-tRNA(Tyr) deacylase